MKARAGRAGVHRVSPMTTQALLERVLSWRSGYRDTKQPVTSWNNKEITRTAQN